VDGSGEDAVDYVDTSAYEVYEKQEGDFVEGEPVEAAADEAAAVPTEDEVQHR
jgi:hypothetical protein